MNPEIKKKWVEALRSGKYRKTRHTLHRNRRFCCLGVLCDLHKAATGGRWQRYVGGYEKYLEYLGHRDHLPPEVVEWAGLDSSDPIIGTSSLGHRNDSGDSFLVIAQVIERSL